MSAGTSDIYFIYMSEDEIYIDLEACVSNWCYRPYDLVFYIN